MMSQSNQSIDPKNPQPMTLVRRLRPEARPLPWEALDAGQQSAFLEIVAWLSSATAAVGRRDERRSDYGGWLDRDRASRIVTLAGGRGTGKTTALLSLIEACQLFREGRERGNYPLELGQTLEGLGPKLVWLEPLDLEPLPKSANLLAAILARIDAEVKRPQGVAGVPGWTGRSFPAPTHKDPLLDLMRLQTDVALAWDGNLSARSGHLDPDVYATEVMRAESARLLLNRRLANLLDDLAEIVLGNRDLLFVLPIDDCDLNPALAVPLLRLLRMTSVPRLFTIVLADELLGRTVFKLKYQGELVETAAPTGVLGPAPTKSLESIADQVGLNALRKLLPPGQRVYLAPMRARTVLALQNGPGTPTIGELLRSFRLRPLWEPKVETRSGSDTEISMVSLNSFIDKLPGQADEYATIEAILDIIDAKRLLFRGVEGESEGEEAGKRRRGAYSGRAFFREPARRAVDLWARLYDICNSQLGGDERQEALEWKKVRLLLNYFAERVRQAIEEDPPFTEWVREMLEAMIEPNWEGDYELDAHYLKLVPPPLGAVPTRAKIEKPFTTTLLEPESSQTNYVEAERDIHGFLAFQEVNDWYIEIKVPNPQDLEEDEGQIRVSRQLRAALTLFSDYVAMYDRERLARGSIRPDPLKLRCAMAHWRSYDGSLDHEVHWPAPDWESLWPYDLLTTAWSEAVRWLNPRRDRPEGDKTEFFAFVWILNATCLVARVIPQKAPGLIPPDKRDWEQLVEATADLIPLADLSRRHRHIKSWLISLPCLLAPEAGLPRWVAEYFVGRDGRKKTSTQKRFLDYWGANAEAIRFNRADVMDLKRLEQEEAGRALAVRFGVIEPDMRRHAGPPSDHPINRICDGRLRPRMYRKPERPVGPRDRRGKPLRS